MEYLAGVIVLGVITVICVIYGILQLNGKGFLFNNAYIFASKQERETMDKKPYYKQTGIIFLMIGMIFLINTLALAFQKSWLFCLIVPVALAAIVYAIESSANMH